MTGLARQARWQHAMVTGFGANMFWYGTRIVVQWKYDFTRNKLQEIRNQVFWRGNVYTIYQKKSPSDFDPEPLFFGVLMTSYPVLGVQYNFCSFSVKRTGKVPILGWKLVINFFCEIWVLLWRHNRGKILIFRQIWYFGLVESKNHCVLALCDI